MVIYLIVCDSAIIYGFIFLSRHGVQQRPISYPFKIVNTIVNSVKCRAKTGGGGVL